MWTRTGLKFAATYVLCFSTFYSFAQSFVYDEQIDGDLSVNSDSPVFQFGVGTNTIIASAYTYVGGSLDADRFEFSIAPGGALTAIRLSLSNAIPLQTTIEVGPTFLISDPAGSFFAGTGGIDAVSFTGQVELLEEHLPVTSADFERLWWGSGGYIIGTPPGGGSWDYVLEFVVESTQGDIDEDFIIDSIDNCLLIANFEQTDSDADGFGNRCDADFDNNCTVNFLDFSFFESKFLTSDELADLNFDGTVNFLDMALIVEQFFSEPGPSALMDQCVPN